MWIQIIDRRSRFDRFGCAAFTLAITLSAATLAQAEEPKTAGKASTQGAAAIAFFEAKIRPVLAMHCYGCHSTKAGKAESGLVLDSRSGVRTGGDRGPAVVPGDVKASVLFEAISHADPDLAMPPKKEKLPASVIADFKTWIERGAADPRDDVAASPPPPRTIDLAAGRQFWSYQKPVLPKLPTVQQVDWAKRDLDRFILARLEAAGVAPSPDADAATLVRRLYFDLIGLPPSPAEVQAFQNAAVKDGLDAAIAATADRLLASPQYGERFGRHWLDVARYAESSGKEANISFPYAFRYRDYVIDAVAADVPFDRFLTEQIAGDLLPAEDDVERARLLIATGFLALGPKNLDEANPLQFEADLIDEEIDTVTRAVLANSVACARCHDHKFEPYAMQDYYALAGVFASTKTYFGTHVSPTNRLAGDPLVLPRGAQQPIFHKSIPAEQVAKLKTQAADLKRQQEEGMAAIYKAIAAGEDPEKAFSLTNALRIFWTLGGIEGQLEKVDDAGQALPLAMGVMDRPEMVDSPLFARGDVGRPGEKIPRGFPRVIELSNAPAPPVEQSGRLELAQWLTHPDHPLTARVFVNRVWRHLFGAGIVRTVDNFGPNGERPTHPELLDLLAVRFVAEGWSTKKLVRELVLSRAYRQASKYRPAAFDIDPENRLVWRMPQRRLEAEAIRDAMLAVSGELDRARPAGSLVATVIGDAPISLVGLNPKLPKDLDGAKYRSVYLSVLRDRLPDVLDLFDFAEPSLVTGDRDTTNVPVQALYLLNGPFVQARAAAFAERLRRDVPADKDREAAQIRQAFELAFGRLPTNREQALAAQFLDRGRQLAGDDIKRQEQILVNFCHALLAAAEFRNLD